MPILVKGSYKVNKVYASDRKDVVHGGRSGTSGGRGSSGRGGKTNRINLVADHMAHKAAASP
ncbi:hypothetical protein PIB30_081355 [Stylosanthes scabra]|uniref:Uncharacterized protein n=1 Tax=Stylosanthes scabra TaxID=79078 RepID=A0ABU6SRU2_9FABA|nr:hypothetical protein [Stylosanthes scabra]